MGKSLASLNLSFLIHKLGTTELASKGWYAD